MCSRIIQRTHPVLVHPTQRPPAGSPFLTELLCFAFLAYPCACAYYAVYRCAAQRRARGICGLVQGCW